MCIRLIQLATSSARKNTFQLSFCSSTLCCFFFRSLHTSNYHFQNLSFNIVVLLRPGLFAWLPEASSPTDQQFHVLWA